MYKNAPPPPKVLFSQVNRRMGLFSPTVACKRPVVTDNKLQELSSLAPDCEPHRIWIRFLTQRFEVRECGIQLLFF